MHFSCNKLSWKSSLTNVVSSKCVRTQEFVRPPLSTHLVFPENKISRGKISFFIILLNRRRQINTKIKKLQSRWFGLTAFVQENPSTRLIVYLSTRPSFWLIYWFNFIKLKSSWKNFLVFNLHKKIKGEGNCSRFAGIQYFCCVTCLNEINFEDQ